MIDLDGGYRIRITQIRAVHPHRPLEPWVRAPQSGRRIWIGYASSVIRGAVFGPNRIAPDVETEVAS